MKKIKNFEDEELIFFIKIQDDEALKELIERYTIKSSIMAKTILRDFSNTGISVDELTNVALSTLSVCISKYRFGLGSFYVLWYTSARRDVMAYLEKNSYKGKSRAFAGISLDNEIEFGTDTVALSDSIGSNDNSFDGDYLLKEFIAVVHNDKVVLIGDDKEVFISYLKGHDRIKIMRKFNISKSTFYRIVQKGKYLLETRYKKWCYLYYLKWKILFFK